MRYCADTWFLLEFNKRNERAVKIFHETLEGKNRIIIPAVSIFELIRLGIRTGESLAKIDLMLNELKVSQKVQVIVLDEAIAKEAAKISVSYDIPAIDSMVAATSKILECDKLLSDDSHLKKLDDKKYIKTEHWSSLSN